MSIDYEIVQIALGRNGRFYPGHACILAQKTQLRLPITRLGVFS